jgi:CubicO group peptidase (beta-lactamase class C family)
MKNTMLGIKVTKTKVPWTKAPKTKVPVVITVLFSLLFFGCNTPYGDTASKSFLEMVEYTTKDTERARITVGIIKSGNPHGTMEYTVYGENGSILPQVEYLYEIGSVTKTFTCSLLCKAIADNKTTLNDSIDRYIALPGNRYYPAFKRLVTHTSGYKEYYFDLLDAANGKKGNGNSYYGINTGRFNTQIGNHLLANRSYPYLYSNFGISAVGSALAAIYGNDFVTLMNNFIASDLGLGSTKISDGTGDLGGYWKWNADDAYIPAGGIVSTISDMMQYVNMHMTESIPYFALGHRAIAEINATPAQYAELGIHMDSAGIGWMLDTENNIIWHNGGTTNFNSYIAFNKAKQTGVVILANLPPNDGIPAVVMGAKLMSEL